MHFKRQATQSNLARGTNRTLWRLFWVLMLALHSLALPSVLVTAATASVSEQLGLVPRIAGLALSAVFFGLKLLDVPWLRARTEGKFAGWRCLIAAVLVVGLLHVGVLDRAIAGKTGMDPDHLPWLIAGAIFATGLLIRGLLADLTSRSPVRVADLHPPRWIAEALERGWRSHDLVAHATFGALRAPPLS